ncbi:MAG TPA: TIGR04282 family arsenosugar biosynthesis glycosyltransferase, partial [Candidatus Binatia bacterium]|nr:TIGR04282 family arsenosugar biosynthesis glycosyltransferase [Candidatus Binatia bacterium]
MPIRANALVVMAKAPIPGSVKTRLMPVFSALEAATLARALLLDQLEHLRALRNTDLYLAFTPPGARRLIRRLAPSRFEVFSQASGDLGTRMRHIFATLFGRGHRRIVLIGGDLPPVPLNYFSKAFTCLSDTEQCAVLGPSQDGGYYLIGLNRDQPALFDQMIWSHDQVLTQTLARLISLDIKSHLLPTWRDI